MRRKEHFGRQNKEEKRVAQGEKGRVDYHGERTADMESP